MQAVKQAEHIARQIDVPVIFADNEQTGMPSASESKTPIISMAFNRNAATPGQLVVQKNAKGVRISSAWNLQNVRMLIGRILQFLTELRNSL
jgi:hypothetical protein